MMNIFDIWFGSVNLSEKIKIDVIKEYKSTQELWYHVINRKCKEVNINPEVTKRLVSHWQEKKLEEMAQDISMKGMKTVVFTESNYPKRLKYIEDAPYIMFYYGDLSNLDLRPNVAIVGSRNCTNYGIDVTKFISKELGANNINIISGLARGIDSVSHRASVENQFYTCAVLGCGLDVIYPRENRSLYEAIKRKGCIISEYFPGTEPFSYNFPKRNRIISALSDIVIVVEAGIKSGSLITATSALQQGKDVIAVPGSVFSSQSKGTNKLIFDGAYPFLNMEVIYNLIGFKNYTTKNNPKSLLSKQEEMISSIIDITPVHIDDIIRATNIDIKQLYELLFEMQLKEEVMCISGNYYVKINKEA